MRVNSYHNNYTHFPAHVKYANNIIKSHYNDGSFMHHKHALLNATIPFWYKVKNVDVVVKDALTAAEIHDNISRAIRMRDINDVIKHSQTIIGDVLVNNSINHYINIGKLNRFPLLWRFDNDIDIVKYTNRGGSPVKQKSNQMILRLDYMSPPVKGKSQCISCVVKGLYIAIYKRFYDIYIIDYNDNAISQKDLWFWDWKEFNDVKSLNTWLRAIGEMEYTFRAAR